MLVSDQLGRHFVLRVGPYGMLKVAPHNPFHNFQIGGSPENAAEIFIEQSEEEKNYVPYLEEVGKNLTQK